MRSILSNIESLYQHNQTRSDNIEAYRPQQCPHCGKAGVWRHGDYLRKADYENSGLESLNPVAIPRFYCPHCGRTCSVLPACIPPHRHYSLPEKFCPNIDQSWLHEVYLILHYLAIKGNIMQAALRKKIKELRTEIKKYKQAEKVTMVIRLKAVLAYLSGRPPDKISLYFDVSKKTVKRWIASYEKDGVSGLTDSARSGRPPKLNAEQLLQLKTLIEKDKERVWVARYVYQFIMTLFAVAYSVKYLPTLLKKIGLSFHKAMHYLVKKNEQKRAEWIKERLPKIYAEHIQEGWRVFFQDEVGFQTEGTLAYSWGPKGVAIEIKNKGRHGRVNLMGVYEVGSGEFFYRMTFFKINALRFKRFLCCLKRAFKTDKIIIIADNASFHKAKWFTQWWKSLNWLRIEFLPAYSPDFNPIERLWKWIKQKYTHNKCWASKKELRIHLEKKLKEMAKDKKEYIGTMRKELLRLKAAFSHYEKEFMWDAHLPC